MFTPFNLRVPKSKTVVSGIGLVTPLGSSRELTWSRLINGETGIYLGKDGLEGRVLDFSPNGASSRMGDFALLAASEAIQHAGLDPANLCDQKVGCAISQSKPILQVRKAAFKPLRPSFELDARLLLSSFMGLSAEAVVSKEFGLKGPVANVVAACATGLLAMEWGRYWIESGQCDIALVGSSESSFHPLYRAGFEQMGVLVRSQNPKEVQPFDFSRSGFAMGEGAAVLVLENEASAERRGHTPLARLQNVALGHSALDPIRFDPEGYSISSLIKRVTGKETPHYINAHGTGTKFNDLVETKAIRLAFGEAADRIPISSTKAATGHLLGAAGSVEAAFSVLALRDQVIPPTLNLINPDPDCDLDYVPLKARYGEVGSSLSLSYGFGGQTGAVLFKTI